MDITTTTETCAACGKEGDNLKKCTACKSVKYCNRDCQISHRPQHKRACKARAADIYFAALDIAESKGEYLSSRQYRAQYQKSWWIKHFETFCASDSLSLGEMKRMTENIFENNSLDDFTKSTFFFLLVMNKKVTADIVEYILDLFTGYNLLNVSMDMDEVNEDLCMTSAYPIHMACFNENCPGDVISLMLEKGTSNGRINDVLYHLCYEEEVDSYRYGTAIGGTPLHYYIGREKNVELNIVKQLLADAPGVVWTSDGETKCVPLITMMWNKNIGKMKEIVQYIVETYPESVRSKDCYDQIPLHLACSNGTITLEIISILLQAWPESINQKNSMECLPIHHLCVATIEEVDREESLKVLRLLIDAYPNCVYQTEDGEGSLPLHVAAGAQKGPKFCEVLVDAYPEAVQVKDGCLQLPIHHACTGQPETLKYLLKLYPEGIHMRDQQGLLPIHSAVYCPEEKWKEIIQVLLAVDPECISTIVSGPQIEYPGIRSNDGALPLHMACITRYKEGLAEFLFDLYPEAILKRNVAGCLPVDIIREETANLVPVGDNPDIIQRNTELITFLETQANCARYAQQHSIMSTDDFSGRLPLHQTLYNEARLGTVKLIYNGYPEAFGLPSTRDGTYPLYIACCGGSVEIVKFLAERHEGCLDAPDPMYGDYPLHTACEMGNCDLIKYLPKKPVETVAVRNSKGKLPIELFCEFVHEPDDYHPFDPPFDPESIEVTETIWCLLLAYPEMMNW